MQFWNGPKIFLAIVVTFVLLAGSFSGGVMAGWLLPLRSSRALDSSQVVGTSQPVEPAGQPRVENTATPNEEPAQTTVLPPETRPPTHTPQPTAEPSAGASNNADLNSLFEPFWQAWELVHRQYVNQPLDDEKLMQGAIRGMLESLGDPHTAYMDPDEYRLDSLDLQGDYEGIGAWVDSTGKYLKIISPMPDSPAEKAGLKAGDTIVAVDGKDVTGLTGNQVIRLVLGPAGSKVTLTIQREGVEKPFDVVVMRAKITVPSVTGKMLENKIAYVQLFIFGDTTGDDLKKVLADLMAKKPAGMILDLRNNGGGYVDTAIQVASQFVGSGVIMYEVGGDGSKKSVSAIPGGLATRIPLVVLVNEGTASASELVAGAIQDYGRGKLVGAKTYGKGSVQIVSELDNHAGAIQVTIAHWLTPRERLIDKIGLEPDIEVLLTEEDVNARRDPQLDRAIAELARK
ncbi:MAG TPA: S41 family peptidase [Anaerolineaceae bacterium]|nr:S41 family peptidase [Anaerolineaceae bacterium]